MQILLTTHRIVAVYGTSSIRMSPITERNGQLRFLAVCRMTVLRWISRKGKTMSRLSVLRWKCGLFHRSASRSVHRSLMCQCLIARSPSINQVTKHAEFPQTLYIGKVVVEMLVVMQRMVPRIRTGLKDSGNPDHQVTKHAEFPQTLYIGKVVVEMLAAKGPSGSDCIEDTGNPDHQVTKHAECPQTLYIGKVVVEMLAAKGPSGSDCIEDTGNPDHQVTKHAECPQTLYIGKVVVEMLVLMQRKVPRIRTGLKTVEIPIIW